MSLAGSSIDVFTEIFLMTSNRNYGGVQGHDLAEVLGNIDFPATSFYYQCFKIITDELNGRTAEVLKF